MHLHGTRQVHVHINLASGALMKDTGINPKAAPSGTGCAECMKAGQWWLHLRRCASPDDMRTCCLLGADQ
jgi:hypothetical protein